MDLQAIINRYKSLGIDDVIDHEKFKLKQSFQYFASINPFIFVEMKKF
jgi:hypothetical protein